MDTDALGVRLRVALTVSAGRFHGHLFEERPSEVPVRHRRGNESSDRGGHKGQLGLPVKLFVFVLQYLVLFGQSRKVGEESRSPCSEGIVHNAAVYSQIHATTFILSSAFLVVRLPLIRFGRFSVHPVICRFSYGRLM